MTHIAAIAAMGRNRELGMRGELLWRIPDDMKRLKTLTMGHPLVMGRKTFDAIIATRGTPLPGRTHIVLTRDGAWTHDGAAAAHSIDEAIALAQRAEGGERVFIFGGAEIYTAALPQTDMLYLTLIDDEKEADAFFPPYKDDFVEVRREERDADGLRYAWVEMARKV